MTVFPLSVLNKTELSKRNSQTAKDGLLNEEVIANKFHHWRLDMEAASWLQEMSYRDEEVRDVSADVLSNKFKADILVNIYTKDKDAFKEYVSIKLVSNNKRGFNQIERGSCLKYKMLWNMPDSVYRSLRLFTGDVRPVSVQDLRDDRRMFLDEMPEQPRREILGFFEENKFGILSDLLRGRDDNKADWFLVVMKPKSGDLSSKLVNIDDVVRLYLDGPVEVTKKGSLKIGKLVMQRKGGDRGKESANQLQFKLDPLELFC